MSVASRNSARRTTSPVAAVKSPPAAKPTPPAAPAKTTAAAKPTKPVAKIDLGSTMVEVWKPTAVVAGKTISCQHTRYGHESLKAAQACIRAAVVAAGGTVEAAKVA
jgi:hypothetical protein